MSTKRRQGKRKGKCKQTSKAADQGVVSVEPQVASGSRSGLTWRTLGHLSVFEKATRAALAVRRDTG